jgi:hypothetical protein
MDWDAMSDAGNPRDLRWADPGMADGHAMGQQELIIAIGNLTTQVMRIADHLTGETS